MPAEPDSRLSLGWVQIHPLSDFVEFYLLLVLKPRIIARLRFIASKWILGYNNNELDLRLDPCR